MTNRPPELAPYLQRLEQLPFVTSARVAGRTPSFAGHRLDALIELTLTDGVESLSLPAEVKRTHLTREVAERLVHLGQEVPGLLILAPSVGRLLGDLFTAHGINYVDLAGNCYLKLRDQFVASVRGQRLERTPLIDKGLRAPAYRALLALLADPSLIGQSARTIALASGGLSPQTASDLRGRLSTMGMLVTSKGALRWAPGGRKGALDLFLGGYSTVLMPALALGRFRSREEDPTALESVLGPRLTALGPWRWGGGAAAMRLTGYFRGDRTLVYVEAGSDSVPGRQLPLVPDPNGKVMLARSPGPLAFQGPDPESVHPVLVYADLLAETDERSRDAAGEVYRRHLATLIGSH
jgi:hypothetical protein